MLDGPVPSEQFTHSKNLFTTDTHINKLVSNKLAEADIAGAVLVVASHDSVVVFSPEFFETLCSKHSSSPNDLRSVSVPSCSLHVQATFS